jgi:hypothetical protein
MKMNQLQKILIGSVIISMLISLSIIHTPAHSEEDIHTISTDLSTNPSTDSKKSITEAPPTVTMIVIPGLSFLELEQTKLPHLKTWMEMGAIGAMNIRSTTGYKSQVNSYATLGLGYRAYGDAELGGGYNADERIPSAVEPFGDQPRALEWVKRWSGDPLEEINVVIPVFPKFKAASSDVDYSQSLGAWLKAHGMHSAVLGNADDGNKKQRFAAWITSDENGMTKYGDVGMATLVGGSDRPYGYRTNYDFLLQQQEKLSTQASLIVIELGDLHRLYESKDWYTEEGFQQVKPQVMGEMDAFIGELMLSMEDNEKLVLLSPVTHQDATEQDYLLAPLLFYGKGIQQGIIHSPTTDRKGIVGNVDVAPTVLHWLGVEKPQSMIGELIQVIPEKKASRFLSEELKQVVTVYSLRPPMLYSYIVYQVSILLVALTLVIRKLDTWYSWVRIPLISLMLAPLLFLWLGGLKDSGSITYTVVFVTGLGVLTFIFSRLPYIQAWMWIGASNVLFILADGWMGGYFIKRSLLGYDPMIGARYYGIGNEYMGIVIGAALLFVCCFIEWSRRTGRWVKWMILSFFAMIVMYFAAPFLGTNAGGALAATIAFGVTWYRCFGAKENQTVRLALFLVSLPLIGIIALFLFNYIIPSGMTSHIGKAFEALVHGDFSAIVGMIKRKLAMNWHLIQVSSWSKLFIASLFVMVVMLLKPIDQLKAWVEKYPYLMAGFIGVATGAIAALLLNDSGIVAAATTIIYLVAPMLLLPIEERRQRTGVQLQSTVQREL